MCDRSGDGSHIFHLVWGQIVILFLIQLGGLGVITVMYGVMMGLHRRLGLGNRWML